MSSNRFSSLLEELPSELMEIIALYLPIQEYYQLAICNRMIFEILWNTSRMWSKLMERDELKIPNNSNNSKTQKIDNNNSNQNYCQLCRDIYSNIFNACLEFENTIQHEPIIQLAHVLDPRSDSMEVNPYKHSVNYYAFMDFFLKVSKFDQLMYIIKNRKKSMVLRGYIIIETIHPYNEEFEKEYTQMAQFLEKENDKETVKQQIDQDEFEDRTLSEIFIKTHGLSFTYE